MPTEPINVYMTKEEYKVFLENEEKVKEVVKKAAKEELNKIMQK